MKRVKLENCAIPLHRTGPEVNLTISPFVTPLHQCPNTTAQLLKGSNYRVPMRRSIKIPTTKHVKSKYHLDGKKRKHSTFAQKGVQMTQRKSIFGFYADSNVLSFLKELAIDQCVSKSSEFSIPRLCNQILRVRQVVRLYNPECPRRKRKFQEFLKGKFPAFFGLALKSSNQQSSSELNKCQVSIASSASSLLSSTITTDSCSQQTASSSPNTVSLSPLEDNSELKHENTNISCTDMAELGLPVLLSPLEDNCKPMQEYSNVSCRCNEMELDLSVPGEQSSAAVESESVYVLCPLSPKNLSPENTHLQDFDDSVQSSNSSSLEELDPVNVQTPRRSFRLLNFMGDYLPRIIVPVGPRFQADVPEWTGPSNLKYLCSDRRENSRLLGTQMWPIKGIYADSSGKGIGTGRPESCCCASPGSTSCVRHHIREQRQLLQSNLGPAFFSWKFNEMGEALSKSWTHKEHDNFNSLVLMNSFSSEKLFWRYAWKCFPSRGKQTVTNYYFNVYVPRRMSMQTRLSFDKFQSDHLDAKSCLLSEGKTRSSNLCSSRNSRTRYLLRPN
ncbi:hypothetical protein RJ641_028455 [Dillenia turbinata]|uniref:ELM2 domain-containing protein n=1 Tax=Dillenia turbinata TaxID=194707 RepID=A0AAN8WAR9_9MAGN